MFNLQFSEVLIILVLALILLGPKQLPSVARKIARGLVELRRAGKDLREAWESEVEDVVGPELRALKNVPNPRNLVDAAWEASESNSNAARDPGRGSDGDSTSSQLKQAGQAGQTATTPIARGEVAKDLRAEPEGLQINQPTGSEDGSTAPETETAAPPDSGPGPAK